MTSILYNRGTNTQNGNPVRSEFNRLNSRINELERKLLTFLSGPESKGIKGDRGEQGEQGERGERGERGEKGERGQQGIQGERGC